MSLGKLAKFPLNPDHCHFFKLENLSHPTCPLSGATQGIEFYREVKGRKIYRNPEIDHYFLWPVPPAAEIAAIYEERFFQRGDKWMAENRDAAARRRRNNLAKLHLVQRHGGGLEGGRLLDVGCALGAFMRLAQAEAGWAVSGVEISDYAAKFARDEYDLDVKCGEFLEMHFEGTPFKAITMWDVIEHLPAPLLYLQKACDLLGDGGHLYMATPDPSAMYARLVRSRWHLWIPPIHLNWFTPKSMKFALEKTGFEIKEHFHSGEWTTFGHILFKLGDSASPIFKPVEKVTKAIGLGNVPVRIGLNDIQRIAAQKK